MNKKSKSLHVINIDEIREKKFQEMAKSVMHELGEDLKEYIRAKVILVMNTILFIEYAEKEWSEEENLDIISKLTNYCLLKLIKTDILKSIGTMECINRIDVFLEENITDKMTHFNDFLKIDNILDMDELK